MATRTGGTLNLYKPEVTDTVGQTIGTHLPWNYQRIDNVVSAHLADTANPHEVKAEQVFALGGIPAGTAFPTNPPSYTLFFRTDLGKLFVYLP